jgi:hypothetical protein
MQGCKLTFLGDTHRVPALTLSVISLLILIPDAR